jgi:hypothetical protein
MERHDSLMNLEKNPKPILITPTNSQHHSRKSISGIDFLNGLKIITNTTSNHDNSTPSSPVPSQFVPEHHFNQIDDFEIKEAIGYT